MVVLPDITFLTLTPFLLLEYSKKCFHFKIPGRKFHKNVQENSEECLRIFQGMSRKFRGEFEKIRRNVRKGSGERSRRFLGIFEKIPGNVKKKSGE